LRNPRTGEEVRQLSPCGDVPWEISFSRDGKWLFSSVSDHTVRLHEVATGEEVLRLEGHDGRVYQGVLHPDGRRALTSAWDLTALVWSLRPAEVIAVKDAPERVWAELASDDAPTAYRAVWSLVDDPAGGADMLRRKMPPVKKTVDDALLQKLIAQLDDENFEKREEAEKRLAEVGEPAGPVLRGALAKSTSAEQRRRLGNLLTRLERERTPDELRILRAVGALELAHAPEALALLREWSAGAPGVLLSDQAREALARWR
jgi:hypothetical protein